MKMGKIKASKIWEKGETLELIALYLYYVNLYQTGTEWHGCKSEAYKPLMAKLNRSKASVENKLMNVSAILKDSKFDQDIRMDHRGYQVLDGYAQDMVFPVYQAFIDAGQINASDSRLPLSMIQKRVA